MGPDSDRLAPVTNLDVVWRALRAGAVAGRGFHYQDLVGAWIALRMLEGTISVERLVAEGLDDLSCEAPRPCPDAQVQVKSRQGRVGGFSAAEAAGHVVAAWIRRSRRISAAADEQVVMVFERPVDGHSACEWGLPIRDDVDWSGVVAAIRTKAVATGVTLTDIELLLSRTVIMVLPQQRLLAESATIVSTRVNLPLGTTTAVVQAVRAAVADCADRNAEVMQWDERTDLTRTDLERVVVDAAAQVDRAALTEALAEGICEPVDFESPLPRDTFYSGVAVLPGHVSAGLVMPRPELTDEVLTGLGSGRPVLITGPSGIGKSAVLWMAIYAARHAVWYRVRRLRPSDVESLVRLARAAGAGRYGPVGLVVDGIGVGGLTAWDDLVRQSAGVPGLLLLGSVREEDTLPIETMADAVVVRPRLDAALAARLHAALTSAAQTTTPHWKEALSKSHGLTMEFTHILTQGARLADVATEQVRARVRDPQRGVELEVLAPISTADQWGATLAPRRCRQ